MALVYNKELENNYTSPDGLFTILFGDEKEENNNLNDVVFEEVKEDNKKD